MRKVDKIKIFQDMEVDRKAQAGTIYLKRISEILKVPEIRVYYIDLGTNAKSKLHVHENDQIVIVLKGRGSVVLFSKYNEGKNAVEGTVEISEGDAVLIPAGQVHSHETAESGLCSVSIMVQGKSSWF